ncbi:MAG: carboxypeptidase regulatory-like domain-containing protein [Acidobacteria bacterium]|nr:carboxypeptidase regulatory-like domain-containing protein [Acidobacteriota bacterium]MBI3425426.1 carboxypeptidase regulatory-like domain-containing protein [Acidobacteriota bacterium]
MKNSFDKRQTGRLRTAVCALLLSCVFSVIQATAQVTTADIVGTVTDNSGAVLPNAKVTVTNLGTNSARNVTTDESGAYTFNLLPIGVYSVKVEAAGFKSFAVANVTLVAGDRTRVDAKMEVGATSETVSVTADASVLQTDTSTVGTAITGKLVQDLPLNGRNYIALALLAPGVSAGPPNGLATGTRPDERRLNSSFSVNGQDPILNNNMIDGMDNNERIIGTIGVRPSIDAIQEFKVQTNLYSAEISRTSGGVVNILTKSGTNSFHGSLFEFVRNDKFDANGNYNFTGNAAAQLPKQKFRQNQYGGSIGGPIIKDRTFFFGDYEKLSIRQGIAIVATVPTAKQRIGDFSENCTAGFNAQGICANAAQQINLVNALGTAPLGAVPFNRLDVAPYAALRDPLALKLAALYPLPTSGGLNVANYASSPVRPQDATTFDGRVDHRFNDKTNFFGRYSFNDITTVQPTGFPDAGGINPGGLFAFAGPNETRAQNIQLNLVRTIRPNLLFEGKVGYLRLAIQSKTINDGKNTANDLGFPCNAVSCVNIGDNQTFGLPRVLIQGFQELGDAIFVPLLQFDNTYQYNGALTWTKGAHNLKFGASLIRRQFSLVQSARPRGEFTFNATAGNAPAPLNFGLANFIAGAPVTIIRQASLYKPGYRAWEVGAYVQDDWRLNKWLTLNVGARYDIYTAKTEQYNRLSNFDPATSTILVAGQNGVGNTAGIATDYGSLAPRFGFAATLGHGMVLRGGLGLSFFQNDTTSAAALKNIPLTSALTCGTSTTGNYANNNCPAGIGTLSQGVPRPLAASGFPTVNGVLNLAAVPPSTLAAIDLKFQTSYNLQYNVVLEKQFGNNVMSVGYVGTRGYDLAMNLPDINRALPSGSATANPRPFAATAPRVTTIGYFTASGTSTYHALQLSFNRRFGKGLSLTSGYNFGNSHDNVTGLGTSTGGYGNLIGPLAGAIENVRKYDWAVSDFNVRHRFSFGANYELPFGKSLKGATGAVLGGWQTNGSLTWQTGLPFTVTDQTAVSGIIGGGGERPNLVSSNIRVSNPTVGTGGQFLDVAAFALPAAFTLGNAPRNVGVGPRQSIINASLFKTFKLYEGWNLQFRTEVFNLPNHPVFGQPNTAFGNAAFGKITTTAGVYAPRQIQFALKLLF